MMLIESKRQYFELAKLNLAGNVIRTWDNANEFLKDSIQELVAIRCTKPGNKFSMYVHRDKLKAEIQKQGLSAGNFYLTTPIPPEDYLIAGELSWMCGDWVLWYSFVQAPMREALAKGGKHEYGKSVWPLLKQHCTPQDIEELLDLFELYTHLDHHPIIEFTVTKKDWGIFPHRNTIIWEIRHY